MPMTARSPPTSSVRSTNGRVLRSKSFRAHDSGADSLAIPTWHYGHEPPTPIASHIAKYFQNSIREDGLLALAKWGIIFTEGKAGTIQEVFQDAAQNYYRSFDWFSPMVLLGVEYWTRTHPVVDVLRSLFDPVDQAECLTVTDDLDEALEAIRSFYTSIWRTTICRLIRARRGASPR